MKNIVIISLFTLILSTSAFAQTSLFDDRDANVNSDVNEKINKAVISKALKGMTPEQLADISSSINKTIEYDIKNNSIQEINSFADYYEYSRAKANGVEYEKKRTKIKDKKQAREFYNSIKPNLVE